ncbi:hypothetical protein QTG54_006839 [Skeletonema marinoi]|uniref:MYND-type domain-containing protein n=1 Tax=Skeletonema marinoi TaxID=267567 RepID=A0AAD9DDQ7_9STRA|nr:hypothetical protein QTG54_006839 [Skeletonema marinoi]
MSADNSGADDFIKCQKDHRPKHKRACKKRAAELHDETLFKQPESSHLGDCPICCNSLPIDLEKSSMKGCCSKVICNGCNYANQRREVEGRLKHSFGDRSDTLELADRVEVNDPVALRQVGSRCHMKGDYKGAFEYTLKAVEFGDVTAHYYLSIMYCNGQGVKKDEKNEVYHLEQAAIGGHPNARNGLGCKEGGMMNPVANLKKLYKAGKVSKDDFAATLRAYQAAVDATKSPQRDAAQEYYETHS